MAPQSRRTRWAVGALISTGILVTFFDRVALSVASPQIAADYGLSLGELGVVLSAFSWSYCAMQLPWGILLDKIGVKWPNRIGTVLWALAGGLAAVATGPATLLASRVVLGVGEGPAMSAAAKATSQWFPLRERGFATALFDAATKLSNVVALPSLALITSVWGWRATFLTTAVLSALFAVLWWWCYRDPDEHPRLSASELRYIRQGGARDASRQDASTAGLLRLALRSRRVWALALGFACYGYAINLLLTWAPAFLAIQLDLPLPQTGLYAAVPWVVATISDLAVGGWLVDKLIRSGRDPSTTRKVFLAIGFALGLAIGLTPLTSDPAFAILWISLSIGGLSIAAPIAWSLPSIVAPPGTVGIVSGMMNFFNTFVSLIAVIVTGVAAELTGSFAGPFLLAGGVLVLGLVLYLPVLGRIEPVAR